MGLPRVHLALYTQALGASVFTQYTTWTSAKITLLDFPHAHQDWEVILQCTYCLVQLAHKHSYLEVPAVNSVIQSQVQGSTGSIWLC